MEKEEGGVSNPRKPKVTKRKQNKGGDMWDINGDDDAHLVLGNNDDDAEEVEETAFGAKVQEVVFFCK